MGEYTRLIPDLLSLHYKVEDDPRFRMENEACYEEIKKLLEDVGCYLKLEDGILSISLRTSSNSVYMQKRKRNSGKKKRLFRNMDSSNPSDYLKFSDIVYLMQSMTDKAIFTKHNIPIQTYYRHKKRLLESIYYKSLDTEKMNNIEYLESKECNYYF